MDEKVTLFLEALASFHASTHQMLASVGGIEAFLKNYPSLRQVNPMAPEFTTDWRSNMEGGLETTAKIAKEYINEEVSIKVANWKDKIWQTFYDGFFTPCGDYQTIIHGDAWQNNVMFK